MSSKSKSKIFPDSDSEDEGSSLRENAQEKHPRSRTSSTQLTFNKSYAERYNQWRGKEELQKLKDRYGPDVESGIKNGEEDENESESSSSDDDDQDWGPEQEKAFLKTLSSLKAKNPKIYDNSAQFFDKDKDKPKAGDDEKKSKKSKDKPFLLKDHERQMILENQGLEVEPEHSKKSYYEELNDIKSEFSSALRNVDSEDEDDELLKKRVKSSKETADEEETYRKWLKGELEKLDDESAKSKDIEELKFLHDYWNDPKLEDGESFLRDYILNRKYIENEDTTKIPSYDEIVHDSDEGGISGDEKQLEQMETFENKYNFRFEEPDQEFIKKYPRTIEETYRRKESKRKTEREKIKERKQAEKERKLAELNQLKALKRKEIMDKLNKLSEITGSSDLPFEDKDLEGDFDPEEYDKRMSSIFNYYEEVEDVDGEKPVFPYDEEIDGGDVEDIECWVPPTESDEEQEEYTTKESSKKSKKKKKSNAEEILNKQPSKQKHSSYQEELIESSRGRRKAKKKSLFLQKLERQKPAFDPSTHESFQQYFDEYYKLDFEDLIGDIPCRFKYRNVVPNDFGLSTEEILAAPDTELNQWASLKKTFTHRPTEEEMYEVQAYSKRAGDIKAKKKKIPTLYASPKDDEDDSGDGEPIAMGPQDVEESSTDKKKKKKRKKKKKKAGATDQAITNEGSVNEIDKSMEIESSELPQGPKKKKKKQKSTIGNLDLEQIQPKTAINKNSDKNRKRKHGQTNPNSVKKINSKLTVDDDRLRAYGINPSQYKKRMKYGV